MEASALPASAGLTRARLGLGAPLLRLRPDEQLVSLFRAGNEDAFRVIHDRYRARMLAYARQMLASSSADAEDAVQEIFVRAYAGLRANQRDLALRAWLYRIAHNRCVDELRRPRALAVEAVEDLREAPGPDPHARVEQREVLRRLIVDVQHLPEQQRSALLMRELGGMPYADLAGAMGVSVPAVKSLLVRARVGLAQASEARDTACASIREDLVVAHDRGVRASGRARRHMRDCTDCRRFRTEVQGMSRNLGLLIPALGPLAVAAKLIGLGGIGGGGSAAAGSGTGAAAGATVTAAGATSTAAGGSAVVGATVTGTTAVAAGGTVAATATTGAAISTGALATAGAAAGTAHVATILAATAIAAGGAIGIQHEVSAAHRPARIHRAIALAAEPRSSASPATGVLSAPTTTVQHAAPRLQPRHHRGRRRRHVPDTGAEPHRQDRARPDVRGHGGHRGGPELSGEPEPVGGDEPRIQCGRPCGHVERHHDGPGDRSDDHDERHHDDDDGSGDHAGDVNRSDGHRSDEHRSHGHRSDEHRSHHRGARGDARRSDGDGGDSGRRGDDRRRPGHLDHPGDDDRPPPGQPRYRHRDRAHRELGDDLVPLRAQLAPDPAADLARRAPRRRLRLDDRRALTGAGLTQCRALHVRGESALICELVQVRRERHRGGRPQPRRHLAPRTFEHLLHGPRTTGDRVLQATLALQPMREVLIDLGGGIGDDRAVARAQRVEPLPAQPSQTLEVADQRARIGGDEDAALAEHGITAESDRAGDVGEVIGRVAGGRECAQRAEAIPVTQTDVNLATGARQRDTWVTRAHRPDRLAVIAVIVGERDPRRTAATSQLGDQRSDVVLLSRPGVDQPRRLVADHPRVRPAQRERTGVVGAEPHDIVTGHGDPLFHGL